MNGYEVLTKSFSKSCEPRQRLTLSAWSDAHRILSAKGASEPGPWRTSRTPYLKDIMDDLSDSSSVQRVVVIKSAQVGLTEVGLNWIGYHIHRGLGPMLVVTPTLEVRDRWIMQRLHPMLSDADVLKELVGNKSRHSANSKDIKDFPGGLLVLSGANSPSSLRSMPIKHVVCDEVDAFPWEVGDEGDPLGLIQARTSNFPRRKVLLISTPTVKDSSRIEEEYERSDQRHYHVPCPHCEEYQPLVWGNLQWDKEFTRAWYACKHCGCEIEEHYKPGMLADGRWIAEQPDKKVRGYHINGLYAPIGLGLSWAELAREWSTCHGDPARLKRFINTTLGETWEDRSHDIKPNELLSRAENYALRTVPPGCLVLTAGVDTQDDRLAVQILGWGRGNQIWVIDWLEIPGDPGRDEVWLKLTDLLRQPLINAWNQSMRVEATAIDTGGHHTHAVYHYVRTAMLPRVMAVKGANTPSKPILAPRPTYQDINHKGKVEKKGVALWILGVDTAKHLLYGYLSADADVDLDDRRFHFSQDLPEDYFKQLTAEVFDPEKNRWMLRRGRRNEGTDTWVYAIAASMHPEVRVHRMSNAAWNNLESRLQTKTEKKQEPKTEETNHVLVDKPAPKRKRGQKRNRIKEW